MSQPSDGPVAVVAVVVLVAGLAITWQVGGVRETQAARAEQQDLVDHQVAERIAAGDFDGDGVADASDHCPTRPETENGFRDGDGCPDVVTTTGAS